MNFKLAFLNSEKKLNPVDDNVDVEITLDNGRVFSATFFTLENIKGLLERYRETGECANGRYIWAADMIIVKMLTNEDIRQSVLDLIESGELEHACSEIFV